MSETACPRCGGALRKKVNVFVDIPFDCNNLSKSGIRSKDVVIEGADWDRATWYCTECYWVLRLGQKE